jgi:sialidase-1
MLNGYPRTFGYGVNWEPMRVVLPGNGQAMMNPGPVVDQRTGVIWLCCYEVRGGLQEHLKDPFRGRVLLTRSTDDGLTWAPPVDLTPQVGKFIPGPGIGIQLRSGRLVIPGYGPAAGGGTSSRVIYSDDGGQTWQAGAAVQGQTDEAQAIEWADGTLMLNMRSNRGQWCRYVALSRDGGETWFREFDEPALPETQCQASLLRVSLPAPLLPPGSGGERPGVLFANPAHPGPWDARTNLTVRLSWDEGQTWPIARQVTVGPAAYSCLAPLRDGTIGLLYEAGREHPYEKITFARFNVAWLTEAEQEQTATE